VGAGCQGTFAEPSLLAYVRVGARWLEKRVTLEKPAVSAPNRAAASRDGAAPAPGRYTAAFRPSEWTEGAPITELSVALLDGKKLIDEATRVRSR
jgi:hypothetical protein